MISPTDTPRSCIIRNQLVILLGLNYEIYNLQRRFISPWGLLCAATDLLVATGPKRTDAFRTDWARANHNAQRDGCLQGYTDGNVQNELNNGPRSLLLNGTPPAALRDSLVAALPVGAI
jgi:hypothetical protein